MEKYSDATLNRDRSGDLLIISHDKAIKHDANIMISILIVL
jgi:hypothetical protein